MVAFFVGCFAFVATCVTLGLMLTIMYSMKKENEPIFEFDTISPFDGYKIHMTVLKKMGHAYSCQTIRHVRMEWLSDNGFPLMCDVYMDEELYKAYLKGMVDRGESDA